MVEIIDNLLHELHFLQDVPVDKYGVEVGRAGNDLDMYSTAACTRTRQCFTRNSWGLTEMDAKLYFLQDVDVYKCCCVVAGACLQQLQRCAIASSVHALLLGITFALFVLAAVS